MLYSFFFLYMLSLISFNERKHYICCKLNKILSELTTDYSDSRKLNLFDNHYLLSA